MEEITASFGGRALMWCRDERFLRARPFCSDGACARGCCWCRRWSPSQYRGREGERGGEAGWVVRPLNAISAIRYRQDGRALKRLTVRPHDCRGSG